MEMTMLCPPARDSEQIEECKELLIDIPSDDSNLPHAKWSKYWIYRVPKQLRKVNEEAYTPKLVSIGPFHHIDLKDNDLKDTEKYKLDLKDMEEHKLKYLYDFLTKRKRTKKISQEDLRKIIKDNEQEIRDSYSEACTLASDEFVNMILLDAVFIIELFLKTNANEEDDYIRSKPWLQNGILHDLILLENQLPFFVLEELYRFTFGDCSSYHHHEEQYAPFVELSCCFFSLYDHRPNKHDSIGKKVKHFTDLVRYLFGSVPGLPLQEPLDTRYCATKLDNAGLKFKAADERPLLLIDYPNSFQCFDCSCLLTCLPCLKCFTRLERMQCILEVPPWKIDDYTEALFRNLVALEQCHYPYETYICSYVVLLDSLINTEEDLDLLIDEKVIDNQLGSNTAVVNLINKLSNQITVTTSCYSEIAKKLNDHYEYPLNKLLATLTSVYFRDFWRGTASIVGLVVLGITFFNFLRPYVNLV